MRSVLWTFAALVLVAPPCAAQPATPVAAAATPYERVYDTLVAQTDDGPLIESALDWLELELAGDPNIAALEAANPGMIEAFRHSVRPVIVSYSQRVKLAYRPRMIALLEDGLTEAEAAEIADFYESPIGRRLVSGVSSNYRADAVLGTIQSDTRVTAADVRRDMDDASATTLQGLSAEEQQALYREIAAHPAIAKLVPVVPRIAALRAQMEEEPMIAEEEAAIQAALTDVFDSVDRPAPPPNRRK